MKVEFHVRFFEKTRYENQWKSMLTYVSTESQIETHVINCFDFFVSSVPQNM